MGASMRAFTLSGTVLICLFVFGNAASAGLIPWITKWELQKHLGSRTYSDIPQKAETANGQALASIKQPELLVDVPASAIVPILAQQLKTALSQLKVGGGWSVSSGGDATFNFTTYAIAATQPLKLSHSKWGTATFKLTVDGVPSLNNGTLTLDTAIADVQVDELKPLHVLLPVFISATVESAINGSLDSLNTRMPHPSFPLQLPSALIAAGLAKPAMMVTPAGVSIMLGAAGGSGALGQDYQADFLKIARKVFPTYKPGSGIIVAANSTQDLTNTSNQLAAQATAANLSTALAILKLAPNADPNMVSTASVADSVLISASSSWLSDTLRPMLVQAIAKFSDPKITLVIPPENIVVRMQDEVAEASASGTAKFLNGALSVQFSLTAWAAVQPIPTGLQVKYALRNLKIGSVSVSWDNRQASFQVPYQDQLGSLIAKFIGTLPTTNIPIPNLPLNVKASTGGTFTVMFAGNAANAIELDGRAILLSPQRTIVLTVPKVAGGTPAPSTAPLAPADGQYNQLNVLMMKAEAVLNGGPATQTIVLLASKPGLASLLRSAFNALNPYVKATLDYNKNYDLGEISAIPANASCGNPCQDVSSCGDLKGCTINVCQDVVVGWACGAACPRFVPGCKQLCHAVTKKVCGDHTNNDCVEKITTCTDGAAKCVASWTSGLQIACENALKTIKANNLSGVAEVSGNVTLDASGQSFKNAQIEISPDLTSAKLSLTASGQGTVKATAHIVWTKIGNLFLCPSGTLSGQFNLAADPQSQSLSAAIAWTVGADQGLTAVISPQDATLDLHTSPPPLQKLVTSNPALLTCGPGQAIIGLTIAGYPKVTQDLLANGLQKVLGSDNGPIAAAVINGRYTLTQPISALSFEIPSVNVNLSGNTIKMTPAMLPTAMSFGYSQ